MRSRTRRRTGTRIERSRTRKRRTGTRIKRSRTRRRTGTRIMIRGSIALVTRKSYLNELGWPELLESMFKKEFLIGSSHSPNAYTIGLPVLIIGSEF
jgi:hypothetical protein